MKRFIETRILVQEEKAMMLAPTAPIDATKFVAYVQERRKKRILFKGEYLVSARKIIVMEKRHPHSSWYNARLIYKNAPLRWLFAWEIEINMRTRYLMTITGWYLSRDRVVRIRITLMLAMCRYVIIMRCKKFKLFLKSKNVWRSAHLVFFNIDF